MNNNTLKEAKETFDFYMEERGMNADEYPDVVLQAGMSDDDIYEIVVDLYNERETEKHL